MAEPINETGIKKSDIYHYINHNHDNMNYAILFQMLDEVIAAGGWAEEEEEDDSESGPILK